MGLVEGLMGVGGEEKSGPGSPPGYVLLSTKFILVARDTNSPRMLLTQTLLK